MAENRKLLYIHSKHHGDLCGQCFETYDSFKCKIEEIPAYSVKLLIRNLVTIFPLIQFYT